ncbi:6-pyruvoyl-tetrahydropterin synthase-related protein [Crocosphaera sp. UHCC 0190]|uniref:6-pyruvoyl-tetrahydropterin synthase-related protein n=1 Tax=Crocosphaera sp. UHCC 0190 TaxID=3110246 RepID=UPI002B1FF6E7|nr:6-pyruvoyl-tetrahydropterin synthase-related protein [Crocosphaera sp. UHCC 0190]MEA5510375.1 6-pyruvoyl-tetrahydropterin synthase-related protein [Crocosphaera sp. UHCC 0190]
MKSFKFKVWKSFNFWLLNESHHLLVILLYGIIAFSLMAPMASNSVIFSTGETVPHLAYIIQGRMALEEGQFPLRVAPYENNGWRYGSFQFYSQIPYTLGGLIYKFLTPYNPYIALKMMLWGSLVIGGFFIYRLSLWLTRSQPGAILAGLSYLSAPYFLNTIHARGAFPEAIAQGILPIVLYYVIKTYSNPKPQYILLSSIAWFALATTHIITFIYGSLFLGILGLLIIVKTPKTRALINPLIRVTVGYILGWLLGFYYLMPVVLESQYVSMRFYVDQVSPYMTNWMTPLANLLSPTALSPSPRDEGITYGLTPAVGWIFLVAWGVVVYDYYSAKPLPPRLNPTSSYLFGLIWIFPLVLFITWSPIDFWAFLPKSLWVTQFTFRFLTHIMWCGALLTGYAIALLFPRRFSSRHLLIGIFLIVMVSRPWLPIPRGTITVDQVVENPQFSKSGAIDYLNRSVIKTLYGKAQLPLLSNTWIPSYNSWESFDRKFLPVIGENEPNWRILPLWQETDKPVLVIEGKVTPETVSDATTLSVVVLQRYSDENKQILGEIPLNQPRLNWRVPFDLTKLNQLDLAPKEFRLQFVVKGNIDNNQRPQIEVDNLFFEGISPENTVIPLETTKDKCTQQGIKTLCEVSVGEKAQVVQLPVLYYSRMQQIKINGQLVEYFPVNYYDYNLVGVRLKPGNYQIQAIFTGLVWANWISFFAWLSVIIMGMKLFWGGKKQEADVKV